MKVFPSDYIKKLNAKHSGGKFVEAAILTESASPLVCKFYVNHEREIVFDGNTFEPVSMKWEGLGQSASMSLPAVRVGVSNIGGAAIRYVEEIDILGNDVELMILHIDLLDDVTAQDKVKLQIQSIEADDQIAVFNLGLNLGLEEFLPRGVMLKSEFPGIVDDVVRINL